MQTIYMRINEEGLEKFISALPEGIRLHISLGEEAGAEVVKVHDIYLLFEIPMYGGEPRYTNLYRHHEVGRIFKEIRSWT